MKNISYLLSLMLIISFMSFAEEKVQEAKNTSEEVVEDVAEGSEDKEKEEEEEEEPKIEDQANYPFIYPDKKFYKPDRDEITENPRSRSAKLRYIERTEHLFRENLDIYSMTKYKRIFEELI